MILAIIINMTFVVVQSLSCDWLFVTPWTAALQAALPFTISQILLRLMSIELLMPSNRLVLCQPLLFLPSVFPSIRVFSNKLALWLGSQSIRASASTSALPMNTQDWFPLGLTGFLSDWLIWSCSPRDSRVFSMALGNLWSLPGKGSRCFWDTFCVTDHAEYIVPETNPWDWQCHQPHCPWTRRLRESP